MNKVILLGNLTRDPELRHTSSDIAVATFTIAINRPFTNEKGEKEADFINIVVWRKQAENVGKFLKKGSKVAVEGKIQTRTYEDEEGNKRHITEVVADNVEFLSEKETVSEPTQEQEEKPKEKLSNDVFEQFGKEVEYRDEDLPFER